MCTGTSSNLLDDHESEDRRCWLLNQLKEEISIHNLMCERAAEAHKSKGSLSRRSRTSSDLGPGNRDSLSVDALLTKNTSIIGQMCERAAEAHKSKGPLSRRSRTSSDLGPGNRDSLSVDALLTKNTSIIGQSAETASHIYFINCLSAIRQPLIEHEVAVNYDASLASTIETQVRALVNKEVDTILRRCGLLSKILYIQNSRIEGQTADPSPLAEIVEFSPPAILECLRSFFGVVTGNEGSLPEFEQLQGPRLRSDVTLGVARALAEAYELLYQAIVDPKSGYPDPKSLVRHSPDQIRTILEI